MIKSIIVSMRPRQWLKNLLLFSPLLFSNNLVELSQDVMVLEAFLLFCLLSGSVYIINDIFDREQDQGHPLKSQRPISSGKIGVEKAGAAAAILSLLALAFSFLLDRDFGLVALSYFLLNLFYSWKLKNVVIIDVMVVALGFVFRVVAGAVVIRVEFSAWILVCTILLALFLVLSKRRHELVLLNEGAKEHRRTLAQYSPYFLDQMIGVVTASTLMSYALYTISEAPHKFGTKGMIYTIPFVLYGIFRYLYLVYQKEEGGDPSQALFIDWPLMVNVALWVVAVIIIIYW